jgi:hypothetical protein
LTPPRENTGAVPLAKLAELDSAAHHLREQTDMDRRAQAERNRDFAERFDRVDQAQSRIRLDVARVSDTCKRLEAGAAAASETQGKILDFIAQQRGSFRTVKFLLGGGILFELARLYLEHAAR